MAACSRGPGAGRAGAEGACTARDGQLVSLSDEFHYRLFLHLCQKADVQVPVGLDSVFMRFDRKGQDRVQTALLIRQYPNNQTTAFYLLIEP